MCMHGSLHDADAAASVAATTSPCRWSDGALAYVVKGVRASNSVAATNAQARLSFMQPSGWWRNIYRCVVHQDPRLKHQWFISYYIVLMMHESITKMTQALKTWLRPPHRGTYIYRKLVLLFFKKQPVLKAYIKSTGTFYVF